MASINCRYSTQAPYPGPMHDGARAVFMFYSEPNEPLPPDAKPGAGIHHPRFGFFLKERMDKLGIECQVHLREEYGGDRTPQMFRDMVAFFQKYFPN